ELPPLSQVVQGGVPQPREQTTWEYDSHARRRVPTTTVFAPDLSSLRRANMIADMVSPTAPAVSEQDIMDEARRRGAFRHDELEQPYGATPKLLNQWQSDAGLPPNHFAQTGRQNA